MLTQEEKERYDRQIRIDGFGPEAQEKLKQSKILIAGAGGLGSSISVYMAIAGAGSLRIVDQDKVSLSNLNRQPLYQAEDIGGEKAQKAKIKLEKLNPNLQVEAVVDTITRESVLYLAQGCDLIVDATDNFPTRYALNEAAVKKGVPLLYGGVYGLEGSLTTIMPKKTACLRCIFPEPAPEGTIPVLGAVPGVIGCLQAMEAIKYLAGIGELLTDRLLIFDGFDLRFREVKLRRNPKCPDCK